MADTLPSILVVDDRPENLYAMKAILRKLEADIVCVTSGGEALGILLEKDFCLAIVDVQMPEMDGYELVELIRSSANTAALPIIFVSAIYSDEYNFRKGYDAGAVDFLSKPVNPEILLSKVRVFIQLWQQKLELQNLINRLQDWNSYLERTVRERTDTLKSANAALTGQVRFQNDLLTAAAGALDTSAAGMRQVASRLKNAKGHPADSDTLQKLTAGERQARALSAALRDTALAADGLGSLARKPLPLPDLITAACSDCGDRLAERNVAIVVENLKGLPPISADEPLARLLFRHVILHALDAAPEGGEVTIAAEALPAGSLPQAEHASVRVTVAYQTTAPADAPHPGLLLAQRIADAHAARLTAEPCGPTRAAVQVVLPVG